MNEDILNKSDFKAIIASSSKLNEGDEYRFQIDFYLFKEDGLFIAYCPSLDLSSSGESHAEAISNFYEAFQLFIETCMESGTLIEALKELGWEIHNATLCPPKFSVLMKNPDFSCLIESQISYERLLSHPLPIPMSCVH